MEKTVKNICFVGNMLAKKFTAPTSQGQIIAELFEREGHSVTCISQKKARVARLMDIIFNLIKNFRKFDIVIHDTFSGLSFVTADVTSAICKKLKIPLVMVLHGGNLPKFIRKYPKWTKRVLKRADCLVSPSFFLAEDFSIQGYEVQVISNVIDLENYTFIERSRISPKLLWMRSFHPIYNPEMAVKVLAKLRETVPDATLTLAGADKGLEKSVKDLVDELNLSEAVRFPGFLDFESKISEFSKADIYLNTNRIDNMPVSVVESRALGVPVVATKIGGIPYIIRHRDNGLLGPNEDVDAMVENIKLLLEDTELTKKISRNGRKQSETAAWKEVRTEWERLFDKVLN